MTHRISVRSVSLPTIVTKALHDGLILSATKTLRDSHATKLANYLVVSMDLAVSANDLVCPLVLGPLQLDRQSGIYTLAGFL